MVRCRECNAGLKKEEAQCYACGAAQDKDNAAANFRRKFAFLIKVAFFASAGLTVASLFLDATPSFVKCAAVTLVLLFVKNSADQMRDRQKG